MTNTYTSEITELVRRWLVDLPASMTTETDAQARDAISAITAEFGFGEPFDREQRAINAQLLHKRANKMACRVAWGFYYDTKLMNAQDTKKKN